MYVCVCGVYVGATVGRGVCVLACGCVAVGLCVCVAFALGCCCVVCVYASVLCIPGASCWLIPALNNRTSFFVFHSRNLVGFCVLCVCARMYVCVPVNVCDYVCVVCVCVCCVVCVCECVCV